MNSEPWLRKETYSGDKTVKTGIIYSIDKKSKVGILVPLNTNLIVYKLFNGRYETFQTMPIKFTHIRALLDTLTISEDGKQIMLGMRYNYPDRTFKLVYQEHNGKYKLTSIEETGRVLC